MTRVLITGSPDWDDVAVIEHALLEFSGMENVTLVSGACPTGADKLCEDFAAAEGWAVERHPADWDHYGKRAGFVRNDEMVASGPDYCVAFIRNDSKGASMTRDIALFRGIPTTTYIYEEKPMFQKYVVGFAYDEDKRIALIMKNRPEWQAGLLNGVGGKIELGETPLEAMVREFDEETGVLISNWELYATVQYPQTEIFFFKARVPVEYLDAIQHETDELIYIFTLEEFLLKPTEVVRNLSWLLPLAVYEKASYLPISVVVSDFTNEGNEVSNAESQFKCVRPN